MRTLTILVLSALACTLVVVLPGTTTAAPIGAGDAVSLEGNDFYIDYFLALNSTKELTDDKSGSDVLDFDKSLQKTMSGPEGTASARSSTTGSINAEPALSGEQTNLYSLRVQGTTNGHTTWTNNENHPGVPVSSPTADMSVDFEVHAPVYYNLTTSLNSSNSDPDDCSEASVELSGSEPVFQKEKLAGGGCGTPAIPTGSNTNKLEPGSYTLSAEAFVSMAKNASGSASYDVRLRFFPDCTITGENDDQPETLNGTPNKDVICGLSGDDTINGGGGNDIILGGLDNDTINGGEGDDQIIGGLGRDTIGGGGDNDWIAGDEGDDTITGDGGDDQILGGTENDKMRGSDGSDSLDGGDGADKLFGNKRKDVMRGGPGGDFFNSKDGVLDKVVGGPGNDEAVTDPEDDVSQVETID